MKVNVTSIVDTGRSKATDAGKQLSDFVDFTSEALKQIITAMRNNLSFGDNVACVIVEPELVHNTVTIINTQGKTPTDIILTRSYSVTYVNTGFSWQFNDSSQVIVKALFDGAPSSPIKVRLVIFY